MIVLMTGITGFLGRRLAAHLRSNGHIVRGLSRSAHDPEQRAPDAESLYAWDPMSAPPPPEALDGVDAVVNLAGEPVVGRWTAAKKQAIRSSRVEGTQNLVAGMRAMVSPPTRLISASAIGYYGDRNEQIADETSPPGDDFLASVCAEWEAAAHAAPDATDVTCVRIAVVLGEDGGALDAMLTPFKLGLGGRLGTGKQWWSWVHIDDVIGIFAHALAHGPNDNDSDSDSVGATLNAASPHPIRQDAFADTLANVLHRPAFFPTPGFVLRTVLGGFAVELLASRRVHPVLTLESGYTFAHPELDGALRDLLSNPSEAVVERSPGPD